VHELDDGFEAVRVGLGEHAVAEVEDVPGKALCLSEDGIGGAEDDVDGGETDGGVEVALQGNAWADAPGGNCERHPPVDSDDVRTCLCHEAEQFTGADTEVDAGDPEAGEAGEYSPRGGHGELGV
jgi:hypothetical protein